jgi:hypothetical protein
MEIQVIERISEIEVTVFPVLMILELMILELTILELMIFLILKALISNVAVLAMNNPSVCDQNSSQEEVQCDKK